MSNKSSIRDYTFRFRATLAPRHRLQSNERSIELTRLPGGQRVELFARPEGPLAESPAFVLKSRGWSSGEEAEAEGRMLVDALTLALLRHHIGVEPWSRRVGSSGYFPYGLGMLKEMRGCRALNDVHGLMVFESDPPPEFHSLSASVFQAISAAMVATSFRTLAERRTIVTDKDRLAINVYNASFLGAEPDVRLVTLVMAVEAVLEPSHRSKPAVDLVDSFIKAATESNSIETRDRESLLGSLRWLREESRSMTARRLIEARLAGREYGGLPAAKFFGRYYEIRSALLHGRGESAALEESRSAVAHLEGFVADLLVAPYLVAL